MGSFITLVTLGVADLQRSLAFYRDGLGMEEFQDLGEVIFFRLQGSWLGLYGREALAEDANVSAQGEGFRAIALAHNVGGEEEVDAVMAHAESAGATIVKAAKKAHWGGYSGYFSDPDGHLWEVAYNPFNDFN